MYTLSGYFPELYKFAGQKVAIDGKVRVRSSGVQEWSLLYRLSGNHSKKMELKLQRKRRRVLEMP